MDDTQPTRISQETSRFEECLVRLLKWMFIFSLLFVAGVFGASAGYQSGLEQAAALKIVDNDKVVQEQYELGLIDFDDGHYELARQRFEYVIALEPEKYPAAWTYLSEIIKIQGATVTFTPQPSTLTPSPTVTITPTYDPSGEESIYNRALSLLIAGDWDGAIEAIVTLRNIDLYYRVVEADGILYAALRNRGEDKVLHQGDLEGGIYDLTLAEKFGPLDYNGNIYRDWARLYLTALGFYEAYPEQAVYYFGQVAAAVPGLIDGAGWTAMERYRRSLIHYGDQLAKEEKWCEAQSHYEAALAIRAVEGVPVTLTHVAHICSPPTKTFTPTLGPTATPTITFTNTSTPTLGPSPSPTSTLAQPADTETPTATNVATQPSTETATATQEHTITPSPIPTETFTPLPTFTFTSAPPTPSFTPLPSNTPVPTNTQPIPSDTPEPTATQ